MKAKIKSKITMFFVALLVMALIVFLAFIASNAQVGYLCVINYANDDSKDFKTKDISLVEKSYMNHFKQSYDIGKALSGKSVYVEHRENGIRFYVEKKRIVTTRRGKEKYRTIKKNKKVFD